MKLPESVSERLLQYYDRKFHEDGMVGDGSAVLDELPVDLVRCIFFYYI